MWQRIKPAGACLESDTATGKWPSIRSFGPLPQEPMTRIPKRVCRSMKSGDHSVFRVGNGHRDRLGRGKWSSVRQLVWVEHCRDRSSARSDRHFWTSLKAYRSAVPFHVRSVLHAEREMYAQVRILLREILHAFIFSLCTRARAHIDRPSIEVA